MNGFVIDLTHGGIKIAIELAKLNKFNSIFAFDIYNTLKKEDKNLLNSNNINIIENLEEFKIQIKNTNINKLDKEDKNKKNIIITPIHSPLNLKKYLKENNLLEYYEIISHHKGVKLILKQWKIECEKQTIPIIEITGVKGKTSTVFMLNKILLENNKDTLILSSLGSHLFRKENNSKKDILLKKNISITPANIIYTIDLAKKIANPKCSYPKCTPKNIEDMKKLNKKEENYLKKPFTNLNYNGVIFESSLGATGLGNIGILTNIIENYSIAKGKSNAKEAKEQIFDCELVVAEKETLDEFYPEIAMRLRTKINSFSINDKIHKNKDKFNPITQNTTNPTKTNPNLIATNISYGLDKTQIDIEYNNLKILNNSQNTNKLNKNNQNTNKLNKNNQKINGKLSIKTFAPGKHHVLNILAAITAALSLNINPIIIQKGLENYKGIPGRSSQKMKNNCRIIEEINPGINTKAIESSITMIKNIQNYSIIIGGKYGITCEEIDEEKLANFLNRYLESTNLNSELDLILTDELGKSLKSKIKKEIKFIEKPIDAQNLAITNNKNILFIYRSNYSQKSKR